MSVTIVPLCIFPEVLVTSPSTIPSRFPMKSGCTSDAIKTNRSERVFVQVKCVPRVQILAGGHETSEHEVCFSRDRSSRSCPHVARGVEVGPGATPRNVRVSGKI